MLVYMWSMNSVCRGLEQQVALPRDSYLQHYFKDVTSVMRVGPPLFFVVGCCLAACLHSSASPHF